MSTVRWESQNVNGEVGDHSEFEATWATKGVFEVSLNYKVKSLSPKTKGQVEGPP